MIGKSNAFSGGGGSLPFGIIIVNYPAGAALTISPAVSVYEDYTQTQRIYYPASAGSFTVTAISGIETATKTVTISSKGESVSAVLDFKYYLLNGYTEVVGVPWILRSIRYNTSSTQHALVNGTSGSFLTLTNNGNTTNNQKSGAFCSANDNLIDLSAFSKLVLLYDLTVTSQAETSVTREAWITLFASYSSMFASNTYQHTGGISFTADAPAVTATIAGTTVTDQRLELPITAVNPLVTAIGVNTRGNGVTAVLTVKEFYAVE